MIVKDVQAVVEKDVFVKGLNVLKLQYTLHAMEMENALNADKGNSSIEYKSI